MLGSELATTITKAKGEEEVAKEETEEEGVDEPLLLGRNLAIVDPILMVNTNNEALALLEVPPILAEEEEHSFVG